MAEVTPAPYPDFDGTQACVEEATETFFPLGPAHPGEPSVRRLEAQAKRVCAGCPFRRPCLAYALTHSEAGIWGGTTEKERDELRRRHGITVGALNVAVPIQLAATPPPPSRMPREAMRALQARYEERLT
ncbi:MAG: WhiB family transcriptional regulator [Actinomycetes bacterium]